MAALEALVGKYVAFLAFLVTFAFELGLITLGYWLITLGLGLPFSFYVALGITVLLFVVQIAFKQDDWS